MLFLFSSPLHLIIEQTKTTTCLSSHICFCWGPRGKYRTRGKETLFSLNVINVASHDIPSDKQRRQFIAFICTMRWTFCHSLSLSLTQYIVIPTYCSLSLFPLDRVCISCPFPCQDDILFSPSSLLNWLVNFFYPQLVYQNNKCLSLSLPLSFFLCADSIVSLHWATRMKRRG